MFSFQRIAFSIVSDHGCAILDIAVRYSRATPARLYDNAALPRYGSTTALLLAGGGFRCGAFRIKPGVYGALDIV